MSNEELARKINAGDESLLPELWDGVEKFIYFQAYKFYRTRTHAGRCLSYGVEVDDLYQMGYFALLMALEAFRRKGKYKIVSYMGFHLKNEFNRAVGLRTEKDRKCKIKVVSLDVPINEGEGTLQDVIKDEEDQYTNALERVYQDEIKIIVHDSVLKLPQEQQDIISQKYFLNYSLSQAAINLGVTYSEASKNMRKALVALRRSREINALREEYISSLGITHTSLSYFKYTWTSAVEFAAMKLEDMERHKSIADSANVPLRAL